MDACSPSRSPRWQVVLLALAGAALGAGACDEVDSQGLCNEDVLPVAMFLQTSLRPSFSFPPAGTNSTQVLLDRPELIAPHKVWDDPGWFGSISKLFVIGGFVGVVVVGSALALIGPQPFRASAPPVNGSRECSAWEVLGLLLMFAMWEPVCTYMFLATVSDVANNLKGTLDGMHLPVLHTATVKLVMGFVVGVLSDHVGRRTMILLCGALLPIAMVACSLAPGMGWFVAGRVLEAIGLAGIVAAYAAIRDLFPCLEERAAATTRLTVATVIANLATPFMGLGISASLGWRVGFLLLAPVMMVCWWRLYLYLPETRSADAKLGSAYWVELMQVVCNLRSTMLLLIMCIIFALVHLTTSSMPVFLVQEFGFDIAHVNFILIGSSVATMAGYAIANSIARDCGVFDTFAGASVTAAAPVGLFVSQLAVPQNSAWMLVGSQLGFNLLSPMFDLAAEVLYMQPLKEVFGFAAAYKSATVLLGGSALVILAGNVKIGRATLVQDHCMFSLVCIIVMVIATGAGYLWRSPAYAVEAQKQFDAALAAKAERRAAAQVVGEEEEEREKAPALSLLKRLSNF